LLPEQISPPPQTDPGCRWNVILPTAIITGDGSAHLSYIVPTIMAGDVTLFDRLEINAGALVWDELLMGYSVKVGLWREGRNHLALNSLCIGESGGFNGFMMRGVDGLQLISLIYTRGSIKNSFTLAGGYFGAGRQYAACGYAGGQVQLASHVKLVAELLVLPPQIGFVLASAGLRFFHLGATLDLSVFGLLTDNYPIFPLPYIKVSVPLFFWRGL